MDPMFFDDNEYDSDTDWICDDGHAHPHIQYNEVVGDPCPFRSEWYTMEDDLDDDAPFQLKRKELWQ